MKVAEGAAADKAAGLRTEHPDRAASRLYLQQQDEPSRPKTGPTPWPGEGKLVAMATKLEQATESQTCILGSCTVLNRTTVYLRPWGCSMSLGRLKTIAQCFMGLSSLQNGRTWKKNIFSLLFCAFELNVLKTFANVTLCLQLKHENVGFLSSFVHRSPLQDSCFFPKIFPPLNK